MPDHAPPAARLPDLVVRALLAAASLCLLAGLAASWAALETSQVIAGEAASADIAARVGALQRLNLGLVAAGAACGIAAALLHLRRRVGLQRWVTICAWTRRVQWQGRWLTFEEFLAQRYRLRCTHGICEEEALKLRTTDVADGRL